MIRNSIARAVSSLVTRPVNGAKLSSETVMKKLFANGEQGFWYDPNDLSTMYQDAGGTVPVTAVGQPVGLIRDKSGRNNHAFQNTSASRPILRKNAVTGANYLEFDGSDDFLKTSNIDFTATDKVSLFAGVRKLSDVAWGAVVELGTSPDSADNSGTFGISAPTRAGLATYGGTFNGTSARAFVASGFTAPHSAVLTSQLIVSAAIADAIKLRINGVQQTPSGAGLWGSLTSFSNNPLYIGRRGGTAIPFNGHLYSLIAIGRLTTDIETMELEKSLAKNTGVTLNV